MIILRLRFQEMSLNLVLLPAQEAGNSDASSLGTGGGDMNTTNLGYCVSRWTHATCTPCLFWLSEPPSAMLILHRLVVSTYFSNSYHEVEHQKGRRRGCNYLRCYDGNHHHSSPHMQPQKTTHSCNIEQIPYSF